MTVALLRCTSTELEFKDYVRIGRLFTLKEPGGPFLHEVQPDDTPADFLGFCGTSVGPIKSMDLTL